MGPHMYLTPDVSLMQGHCDKSTSHVITGPKCVTSITQLFLLSLCMLFVAPISQEFKQTGQIYTFLIELPVFPQVLSFIPHLLWVSPWDSFLPLSDSPLQLDLTRHTGPQREKFNPKQTLICVIKMKFKGNTRKDYFENKQTKKSPLKKKQIVT